MSEAMYRRVLSVLPFCGCHVSRSASTYSWLQFYFRRNPNYFWDNILDDLVNPIALMLFVSSYLVALMMFMSSCSSESCSYNDVCKQCCQKKVFHIAALFIRKSISWSTVLFHWWENSLEPNVRPHAIWSRTGEVSFTWNLPVLILYCLRKKSACSPY